MSLTPGTAAPATDGPFRHEAVLHAGGDQLLEVVVRLVGDAVSSGDEMLVVLRAEQIRGLHGRLPSPATGICLLDLEEAGQNAARLLSLWVEFVERTAAQGTRARGVTEPIVAGQCGAELSECQYHEALLNLAISDPMFRLFCLYDASVLSADILAEARRVHPLVDEHGSSRPSSTFAGAEAHRRFALASLAPPPPNAAVRPFWEGDLPRLRRQVAATAEQAGLAPERTDDLVAAANEIATNSLRHGGGKGTVSVWSTWGSVVCEIRDAGILTDPLAGRRRPAVHGQGGRGLWLAHHLCDQLQIRSGEGGTVVRLRIGSEEPAAPAAG